MPQGLLRVLNSSKVWTAIGAMVAAVFAVLGLDTTKALMVVSAISGLAVSVIAATGYEDGQQKGATSPLSVTTVGSGGTANIAPNATSSTATITKLLLLLLIPAMLLSAGCTGPAKQYTSGDAATFNAVAPEYQHYVVNDASLDADKIARRERTLATWSLRLKGAGETPTTLPAATQPTK